MKVRDRVEPKVRDKVGKNGEVKKKKKRCGMEVTGSLRQVRDRVEWRSETVWSKRSETGWNGGQRQGGREVRDRTEWKSDRVEWRSDRVEWRSETGWNRGQRQAEARSKTVFQGQKQMRVKKVGEVGMETSKTGRSGEGGNRQKWKEQRQGRDQKQMTVEKLLTSE